MTRGNKTVISAKSEGANAENKLAPRQEHVATQISRDDSGQSTMMFDDVSPSRVQRLLRDAKRHPWWRLESALIGGAVVCALMSGVLAHSNSNAAKRELSSLFSTRETLVAARDIKYGEKLDQSMLRVSETLERNASTNLIIPKDAAMIIGKRISVELRKGDPILLSAVQGATEASRMAETIPPGKRLFTLQISDAAASHGFIKPNDRVDIMAHVTLPDRGLTTFTVLQDITLVSVGPSTVLNDSGKATGSDVSFFVEAKDIEMLAFAQKRGQFSLSLRNPADVGVRTTGKGIDINGFLDYEGIHSVSGGGKLDITEQGRKIPAAKAAE